MSMWRFTSIVRRNKNTSRLVLATVALAAASIGTLLTLNAPSARAAGSSRLGFSCDVNTTQCTCTGARDGADCKAMRKNCDTKCDAGSSGECTVLECTGSGCSCKMARTGRPTSSSGADIRTGAGLCLDVHAPDMGKNGGRVQVWACSGQPQQRWTYDRNSRAVRVASGLCLDVHAPEMTTNGGRVQVWACNAAQQQQWTPLANGSLQNAGGLCLDVHDPDQSKNGGRVQVWQCNASQQQRFTSSVFRQTPTVSTVSSTIGPKSISVSPGDSVAVTGTTARISRSNGVTGDFVCSCSGEGTCSVVQTPNLLVCTSGTGSGACKSPGVCQFNTTTTGVRPTEVIQ